MGRVQGTCAVPAKQADKISIPFLQDGCVGTVFPLLYWSIYYKVFNSSELWREVVLVSTKRH